MVRFAKKEGAAPEEKPVQISEEVRLYHFDVEAELSDSLFTIAEGK